MRGVQFGPSGSYSRVARAERKSPNSQIVSVWFPLVTTRLSPMVRTGLYMIRLGSMTFELSKASVRMPSSVREKILLRLFSLLPMIK